jgi:hypothetical protein
MLRLPSTSRTARAIGLAKLLPVPAVTNRSLKSLSLLWDNLCFHRILDNGREERQLILGETSLEAVMPTLIRFLTIVALFVGLFYGAMFVLANFFEPQPREMTKSLRDVKVK